MRAHLTQVAIRDKEYSIVVFSELFFYHLYRGAPCIILPFLLSEMGRWKASIATEKMATEGDKNLVNRVSRDRPYCRIPTPFVPSSCRTSMHDEEKILDDISDLS